MPVDTAMILGLILALVGTVLLYVFVLPRRMNGRFPNPFLQVLHDFFHFKQLFIETIMKFLYIVSTLYCIGSGFFMLFAETGSGRYAQSTASDGLIMMLLGPIVIRIFYEVMMMGILLVQNVIDINKKLSKNGKENAAPARDPYAPVSTPVYTPTYPNTGYNNQGATAGYNNQGTTAGYNNQGAYNGNQNNYNGYQGNNQY